LPEQGADWYLAAQAVFQGKNAVASLIGGAEKHTNKDGATTIIDHKVIREQAKLEGIEHAKRHRDNRLSNQINGDINNTPRNSVLQVAQQQSAMPERVAEHASKEIMQTNA
jgi:hypothetical protein